METQNEKLLKWKQELEGYISEAIGRMEKENGLHVKSASLMRKMAMTPIYDKTPEGKKVEALVVDMPTSQWSLVLQFQALII